MRADGRAFLGAKPSQFSIAYPASNCFLLTFSTAAERAWTLENGDARITKSLGYDARTALLERRFGSSVWGSKCRREEECKSKSREGWKLHLDKCLDFGRVGGDENEYLDARVWRELIWFLGVDTTVLGRGRPFI
jgi:hypothetical protein